MDDNRDSVFPLSPIAVLWVNMVSAISSFYFRSVLSELSQLTSSPPAFGLGMEPAFPDLMLKPPHNIKDGVFSWPIIVDTLAYGIVMGATSLCSASCHTYLHMSSSNIANFQFIIVVYGRYDGNLAQDCNHEFSEGCSKVFRARSTTFATLIFQILLYAFELKSCESTSQSFR